MQKFSVDATAFYNSYDNLIGSSAPGKPIINPLPYFTNIPVTLINEKGAQTHGLEFSLKFNWVFPSDLHRFGSPCASFLCKSRKVTVEEISARLGHAAAAITRNCLERVSQNTDRAHRQANESFAKLA
jgi:hypothetical protein